MEVTAPTEPAEHTAPVLRSVRSFLAVTAACLLAVCLNLWWTSHDVSRLTGVVSAQRSVVAGQRAVVRKLDSLVVKLRHEVRAECRFNADLAPLPVTGPTNKRASLLGVEIIADARAAWHQAACPGTLPLPSPSLLIWARHYGREVR